uniref:Transposase n=1 Tax=Haemonchus placei TaxID=6290 RepID=A0A0N4WB69_HAEPC
MTDGQEEQSSGLPDLHDLRVGLLRDGGDVLVGHVKQLRQQLNDSSHRHLRRILNLPWMAIAKDRSEWFVAGART